MQNPENISLPYENNEWWIIYCVLYTGVFILCYILMCLYVAFYVP